MSQRAHPHAYMDGFRPARHQASSRPTSRADEDASSHPQSAKLVLMQVKAWLGANLQGSQSIECLPVLLNEPFDSTATCEEQFGIDTMLLV